MVDHCPQRIILHVGTPKTGTTAIQSAMATGREQLSGLGVCYPKAGEPGRGLHGHHNLAYEIAPGPNRLKFRQEYGTWANLVEEVRKSGASTVLISSEAFRFHLARLLAARIAEFWPAERIEVVLYLRPQWEYIESGYNQLARFGGIEGESIAQFWMRQSKRLGDYRHLISVWEQNFPNSLVTFLPYTRQRMEGGIVQDFESNVLRSGHTFGAKETSNPKVGMRAISAVQYVKSELRRKTAKADLRVPNSAVFSIRKLFTERFADVVDFTFMTATLEAQIAEECNEINSWLRSRYPLFAQSDFGHLPSRPRPPLFEETQFEGAERAALDEIVRMTLPKLGRL